LAQNIARIARLPRAADAITLRWPPRGAILCGDAWSYARAKGCGDRFAKRAAGGDGKPANGLPSARIFNGLRRRSAVNFSSSSRGSAPWIMNGGRGRIRDRAVSGCCFGRRIHGAYGGACVTSSSAKSRRRNPPSPRARAGHRRRFPKPQGTVARGGNRRAGDRTYKLCDSEFHATVIEASCRHQPQAA